MELLATELNRLFSDEYHFLFIAKGGGSANKTFLYQQTKALLNTGSLEAFLEEKIKTIGTSACPPYHLAIVIGGLSAEQNLKTVKLSKVYSIGQRGLELTIVAIVGRTGQLTAQRMISSSCLPGSELREVQGECHVIIQPGEGLPRHHCHWSAPGS